MRYLKLYEVYRSIEWDDPKKIINDFNRTQVEMAQLRHKRNGLVNDLERATYDIISRLFDESGQDEIIINDSKLEVVSGFEDDEDATNHFVTSIKKPGNDEDYIFEVEDDITDTNDGPFELSDLLKWDTYNALNIIEYLLTVTPDDVVSRLAEREGDKFGLIR